MTFKKVLIVDDEPQMRRVLRTALIGRGYEVTDARTGEEAIQQLRREAPDIVLLDLKMPGMGGMQSCRAIHADSSAPIMIISVTKSEKEKVEALEAGADDFLTKPFGMPELLARIHAIERRYLSTMLGAGRVLALDGTVIDLEMHEVRREGYRVHLTAKEYELLRCLASNADKVVSHRRLLQAVWGPDYGEEVEYLRVFINQLRKKIEPDCASPRYIITEPNMGYRLALPEKTSGKRLAASASSSF